MKNLSITLNKVGLRKSKIIQSEIMDLMEKHNIKSASFITDYKDINDITTFFHHKNELEYIYQYNDYSCQLITLLNAFINKYGKSPLGYKTTEFWRLVEECSGSETSPIRDISIADNLLDIERESYNGVKNINSLKEFCIEKLEGNQNWMIDLTFARREDFHSCLLVDYDCEYESFKCINGNLLSRNNPVEYVSWKQLMEYTNKKDSLHSKKEKMNFSITNTSAIRIIQDGNEY